MIRRFPLVERDTLTMARPDGKRFPVMILALFISRGLQPKDGILDPYEKSLKSFIESNGNKPKDSDFFIQMAEVRALSRYFRKDKWPEVHHLARNMDLALLITDVVH